MPLHILCEDVPHTGRAQSCGSRQCARQELGGRGPWTPGPKRDCLLWEGTREGQGQLKLPLFSSLSCRSLERDIFLIFLGGSSLRLPLRVHIKHEPGVYPSGIACFWSGLGRRDCLHSPLSRAEPEGDSKLGKGQGPCRLLWPVMGTQVDTHEGVLRTGYPVPTEQTKPLRKPRAWCTHHWQRAEWHPPTPTGFPHRLGR